MSSGAAKSGQPCAAAQAGLSLRWAFVQSCRKCWAPAHMSSVFKITLVTFLHCINENCQLGTELARLQVQCEHQLAGTMFTQSSRITELGQL